jgi:hypothetical protein
MIWRIHTQTNHRREGLTKYFVEMCSGAMICIKSFVKIGSGIQKLTRDIHGHTDSIVIS